MSDGIYLEAIQNNNKKKKTHLTKTKYEKFQVTIKEVFN